ncbi:MAG: hypothetical protein MUP03_01125, partial [Anaerolineales bacterium]|nr:hypothetical protein [Anaerolineales bacterium]
NRLPNRGQYSLTGHSTTTPVTFYVECWGLNADGVTLRMGRFTVSHPSRDWNSSLRTAAGDYFRLRYCLGSTAGTCGRTMVGVDPSLAEGVVTSEYSLLPPTNLRFGYGGRSSEICDDAPSDQQYACRFMVMIGGVQSLMWDWSGGATIYNESMLTGYHVVRRATDSTGFIAQQEWDVLRRPPPYGLLKANLPRIQRDFTRAFEGDCGMRYTFTVAAMVGDRRSPPSEALTFSTAPCSNRVELTVSFVSMQLNVVCDYGEDCFFICPAACDDQTLEADGNFEVVGAGTDVRKLINGDNIISDCRHLDSFDITSGTYRGGQFLITDQYPINQSCRQIGWYNNNVIRATISQPFRTVTISLELLENDTTSTLYHGRYTCHVLIPLAGRSMQDWANFRSQTVSGASVHSDADCVATFYVYRTGP